MTFDDILDQAIAILQRRGRVTYRTLKRQFALDDAALEELKEELIALLMSRATRRQSCSKTLVHGPERTGGPVQGLQ